MSTTKDVAVFVGSLRKDSFNRKMAKALPALSPATLKPEIVEIGQLPLYNQDDDVAGKVPPAWQALRDRVKPAGAVLFVTPEYNRSVPACSRTPSTSPRGRTGKAPSTASPAP